MFLSNFKNSNDASTGVCPAPPPPPPPPVPGQVPALRISTSENSAPRPKPSQSNDVYEPPAAIQNAMLTKDKKPFTYTPGMGGKLDLSQIRSPRMARRVAKNANDEGIEGPPKSAMEPKPAPTQAGANIYIQPQVAVPVFPANMPTQPAPNKTVVNNINRAPVSPPEKQIELPKVVTRVETKPVPNSTFTPSSPESPTSPTQVTLAKAPTPWMKRTKSQEEDLPEWARRTNKSQESSPENAASPPVYTVQQSSPPPPPQRNQIPQNFANQRPQPQQKRQMNNEHVIPLRIEDRPSVFSIKQEQGHHQFKEATPQHQQRWGQQSPQSNQVPVQVQAQTKPQNQVQYRSQDQMQPLRQNQVPPKSQNHQSGGAFIVPMVIEGQEQNPPGALIVQSSIPSQTRIIPIQPASPPANSQRNPMQQAEPGPIQSKSFRVLQKITSTDLPDEVDGDQLRKLQLTEDDRMLMNKFKEHVDNDNYLHQEEDPRYRGAAIPSRAFRYLQNMTDAGEITTNTLPRVNNALNKKQNRNSKTFEEGQASLPPSQQQVSEPKKYTGSAIPSRSFRILQAMTEPQSIATQEYQQADSIFQTENYMMGNQQGIFFPACIPNTYWNPEDNFWGYFPLPSYAYPQIYPNNISPSHYNSIKAYTLFPSAYRVNPFTNEPNRTESTYSGKYYQRLREENGKEEKEPVRRNSALLFSPKTIDMTMLTDDTKLSTNSRARIVTHYSDDSDSDMELSRGDSSSSDSDSDSYLAYSTGLNPIGNGTDSDRFKDSASSPSITTISEDTYEQSFSEKQNSSNYSESDEEESLKEDFETSCHDRVSDNGTTTVSVSLPLRFKFSVSENNEDVAMVIVGDSTIKPERNEDVKNNIEIGDNNVVDFTLKRKTKREIEESEKNLHAEFTIKVTKSLEEPEMARMENEDVLSVDKCASKISFGHSFETDDEEDSGVTSDVSRIISEIDTDSECCPTVKRNKFQRTQTHSRLFKLLTESNSSSTDEDGRRNRLSLPANFGSFNYDEYCSSNDLSWKRLHETDEEANEEKRYDPYYQTWKSPKSQTNCGEIISSPNHQVLGNKKLHWRCKLNIQCPRIKSSKNVPLSLKSVDSKLSSSIPS